MLTKVVKLEVLAGGSTASMKGSIIMRILHRIRTAGAGMDGGPFVKFKDILAAAVTFTSALVLLALTIANPAYAGLFGLEDKFSFDYEEKFSGSNGSLPSGWSVLFNDDDQPAEFLGLNDGAMRITRLTSSIGNGAVASVSTFVNMNVNQNTLISFDANPITRNVAAGCGFSCGEFPINLQLRGKRNNNEQTVVRYAVNYGSAIADKNISTTDVDGNPLLFVQKGVSVPQGEFTALKFRLGDQVSDITTVQEAQVFGAGWNFDGALDNLNIDNALSRRLRLQTSSGDEFFVKDEVINGNQNLLNKQKEVVVGSYRSATELIATTEALSILLTNDTASNRAAVENLDFVVNEFLDDFIALREGTAKVQKYTAAAVSFLIGGGYKVGTTGLVLSKEILKEIAISSGISLFNELGQLSLGTFSENFTSEAEAISELSDRRELALAQGISHIQEAKRQYTALDVFKAEIERIVNSGDELPVELVRNAHDSLILADYHSQMAVPHIKFGAELDSPTRDFFNSTILNVLEGLTFTHAVDKLRAIVWDSDDYATFLKDTFDIATNQLPDPFLKNYGDLPNQYRLTHEKFEAGAREAFEGLTPEEFEQFISGQGSGALVELDSGNKVARITTGSPTSITVDLGEKGFIEGAISFDYKFESTEGTVQVFLGELLIATLLAPDELSDEFLNFTFFAFIDELGDFDPVLRLVLDGPTGISALFDNIEGTSLTASGTSIVAVPLPITLPLLAMAITAIGLIGSRRVCTQR